MKAACSQKNLVRFFVALIALPAVLVPSLPALAQVNAGTAKTTTEVEKSKQQLQQTIDRLTEIRQSLIERQRRLTDLRVQLGAVSVEEGKQEPQAQLDELNGVVKKLNASFEQIAIGGIDLEVFSERPADRFDWRQELIKITQPILATFNDLTEKLRKI